MSEDVCTDHKRTMDGLTWPLVICLFIIIIIHEFHRDASLETKLQGRYVSHITLQL